MPDTQQAQPHLTNEPPAALQLVVSGQVAITEFTEHRANRTQAIQYNARVQAALDSVLTLRKPTIAMIKGYCVRGR